MKNKSKFLVFAMAGFLVGFGGIFSFGSGSDVRMKCGGGDGNYEAKCIDVAPGKPLEGANGVKLKGGIGSIMNSTDSVE